MNILKFNQDKIIIFFQIQPPLRNNVEIKFIFLTLLSDSHYI